MQLSLVELFMKLQVQTVIGIGKRSRLRLGIMGNVPRFINRVENGTVPDESSPMSFATKVGGTNRKFHVILLRNV